MRNPNAQTANTELRDLSVGATSLDLLIYSSKDIKVVLKSDKVFSRDIKFELISIHGRLQHHQAKIGAIKSNYRLTMINPHNEPMEYAVAKKILNRVLRTHFPTSGNASNWYVKTNESLISLIKRNVEAAPSVSEINVYNGQILISLSDAKKANFELYERSNRSRKIALNADSNGIISISKDVLETLDFRVGDVLLNLTCIETRDRLRLHDNELGEPRKLFSYPAIKLNSRQAKLSLRPYWTTDGYLSFKLTSR